MHAEDDWSYFLRTEPWSVPTRADSSARRLDSSEGPKLCGAAAERFPILSVLVDQARSYGIRIANREHRLLVWDRQSDGTPCGWILGAPGDAGRPHPDHRLLLDQVPGITSRLGEVPSWLLNAQATLLAPDTQRSVAFVADCARWERAGVTVPIDLNAFYPMSWENGRTTIVHRMTGELLIYAPDHSMDYVEPLKGCPEYTLYRIPSAPDLASWVERVATQWLAAVK